MHARWDDTGPRMRTEPGVKPTTTPGRPALLDYVPRDQASQWPPARAYNAIIPMACLCARPYIYIITARAAEAACVWFSVCTLGKPLTLTMMRALAHFVCTLPLPLYRRGFVVQTPPPPPNRQRNNVHRSAHSTRVGAWTTLLPSTPNAAASRRNPRS